MGNATTIPVCGLPPIWCRNQIAFWLGVNQFGLNCGPNITKLGWQTNRCNCASIFPSSQPTVFSSKNKRFNNVIWTRVGSFAQELLLWEKVIRSQSISLSTTTLATVLARVALSTLASQQQTVDSLYQRVVLQPGANNLGCFHDFLLLSILYVVVLEMLLLSSTPV